MYKNLNINRVNKEHLIIEAFGPELTYIKGSQNIVVNNLSKLDKKSLSDSDFTLLDHFAITPVLNFSFLISIQGFSEYYY